MWTYKLTGGIGTWGAGFSAFLVRPCLDWFPSCFLFIPVVNFNLSFTFSDLKITQKMFIYYANFMTEIFPP